mgnify:CR=1 FL=1
MFSHCWYLFDFYNDGLNICDNWFHYSGYLLYFCNNWFHYSGFLHYDWFWHYFYRGSFHNYGLLLHENRFRLHFDRGYSNQHFFWLNLQVLLRNLNWRRLHFLGWSFYFDWGRLHRQIFSFDYSIGLFDDNRLRYYFHWGLLDNSRRLFNDDGG